MKNMNIIIEDKNQTSQTFALGETVYVIYPECILTKNGRLRLRHNMLVHKGRLEEVHAYRFGIELKVLIYPVKNNDEQFCVISGEYKKTVFRNRMDAEAAVNNENAITE